MEQQLGAAPQSPQRPDVEAIEARAKTASPGPWYNGQQEYGDPGEGPTGVHPGGIEGIEDSNEVMSPNEDATRYGHGVVAEVYQPEDRAFVIAARTDIPSLLAWIRHLEAEAVELKDVIKVRDHEAREEIRRIRAGEID